MTSVLQEWVMELPLKMQSVLMTATRGPDNYRYMSIKVANRWIRSKLFYDADPANPFIIHPNDPSITNPLHLSELQRDLEYTTVHYYSHLLHAFEIIGYMHPDEDSCTSAQDVYWFLCEVLHVRAETKRALEIRLASPEQGVIHE